ncbi:DUF4214 domain-containing protein [Oceanicoccus sagamiensis]|uniref:DUF4214 domain-containing protein n=1 Tax=Oceanicoccus sagamiensis TaxID=716816 RepID=A0A1X9NEU0_9GAMM|nr:DUF4214 domain-containing protein [Oceanicoccus sagamiensis]ARN74952.1 hypothetical protein BST96_13005 [Oceanicoccus sagamiensis]
MNKTGNRLLDQVKKNIQERPSSPLSNNSNHRSAMFDIEALILPGSEIDRTDNRKTYQLEEFLTLYDGEFVHFCYQALFKRAPDKTGMSNILKALRVDKVPRIEIIKSLMNSDEAQQQQVIISDFATAHLFYRIGRVPVIGFLIRLAIGLRKIARLQEEQEYQRGLIEATRHDAGEVDNMISKHQNRIAEWLAEETGNASWAPPDKEANRKPNKEPK